MQVDVGIIGGTGIGERLTALGGFPIIVRTPVGAQRARVIDHDGLRIALLSRHSDGHKVPPHRVNYAAMALALKSLGARGCLSSAAVGSLDAYVGPGSFWACNDFIDVSARNVTLFDRVVEHRDFSEAFDCHAHDAIMEAGGHMIRPNAVYVCVNGPRYETPHEIKLYQRLGGTVVGMTATSEAIAMREAEIPYGCLAIVTNLASGLGSSTLHHGEVVDVMQEVGAQAVEILLKAAKILVA